jgi:hypothetical protein
MLSLFKALSVGFCLVPFVTAFTYTVDVGKNSVTGFVLYSLRLLLSRRLDPTRLSGRKA